MNKIVVTKAIKRNILGHLILCGLLGLSGTIQATTPAQQLTQPLPQNQLLIPANEQCLYTAVIMGYLLPVRQEAVKVTARVAQLFGDQPAYYLDALHQTLQNPIHYFTYLHSDTFSTLITVFMARMQIKEGTWGGPQEIQTIATKLNVNIQEYYPDPSNRTTLLQSNLTKPAQVSADITLHIVRDRVHSVEVLTQTEKASAVDKPRYQHYRLKYTLPASIPVQVLPNKQFSIPHEIGSQQKNSIQPYLIEWFKAAKAGNRKSLEELHRNYNINVNTRAKYENTALLYSAYSGHLDCIQFLLQQGAGIYDKNENGDTALILSAKKAYLSCVKFLVQQGADINSRDKDGDTAFLRSAQEGHLDCVKFLRQQGADINVRNKYGDTALLRSAQEGHLDCVKYLLQQGADVDTRDKYEYTALLSSAQEGHLDCVKLLLQQGANIKANAKDGYTALLLSAYKGHIDSVNYLLQKGANINEKNKYGHTALILSAKKGHLNCVKFLIQQGADLNIRDKDGYTALLQSAREGQLDCVKFLLQQGVYIKTKAKDKYTALLLSSQEGHLGCVKYLIQEDANVTLKGQWNKTALQWAAARDQQDVVKYLLTLTKKEQPSKKVLQKWFEVAKTGNRKLLASLYNNYNINVNARNKYKDTALLWSAYNGHVDCLEFLIQQGAGIHDKSKTGNTALILSAYKGHLDCVKLLVQQGANIHDKNQAGNTALLYSADSGHLDCVKFLVQQGADIHAKNENRDTALLLSAYSGHLGCLKFLLQQSGSIHDQNKNRDTALILSAYKGHLDCVKLLVQQGANVTLKGQQNKTALQWAKEKSREDVVNYLSNLAKKEQSSKTVLQKWFEVVKNRNRKSLATLDNNYNINVNVKNENRDTAALWSANNGHLDRLKWLLQQGASIHDKNETENTALTLNAQEEDKEVYNYSIENGANKDKGKNCCNFRLNN